MSIKKYEILNVFVRCLLLVISCICFCTCQTNNNKEELHWAYVINDIPLDIEFFDKQDSIPIPHPVYSGYEEILDSIYLHSGYYSYLREEYNTSKDECFEKTFFVIPADSNLLIFVMYYITSSLYIGERFAFIAYDLKSGQYSQVPYDVGAFDDIKYDPKFRLIAPPVFRFDKEKCLFVVKDHAHNGNVYIAVWEYWVKINPDMSLTELFEIESSAFVPFDESHRKIARTLDENLCLNVILTDIKNNFISNIGTATLSHDNNGIFEWSNIQLSDTIYKGLLISCEY